MTATLALDAPTVTEPSREPDRLAGSSPLPARSSGGRRRATPGRGAAAVVRSRDKAAAVAQPRSEAKPALRIRPVPRSEPLTDEERMAGLPDAARLLPPDLATGVRVRRGSGARAASGGSGHSVGAGASARAGGNGASVGAGAAAGDARSVPAPTVLRTPEAVMTLVATALHATPPARSRRVPAQHGTAPAPAAPLLMVSTPGLGRAPTDAPVPPRSPDLRATAKRLLGTCIEVLGGFRPVAQLRPYCAPERFDVIANRLLRPVGAGRGHGATRSSLITGRATSGRPGRPARMMPEDRIVIRRVQICDVMEGIVELAVVMARHNKVWAMTMRMERSRGRWLCMHLEVL